MRSEQVHRPNAISLASGAVINIDTATIGGWWALCGPYEFTDCRFVDEAPDNGDLDKPYHYEPSGSEMNGPETGWVWHAGQPIDPEVEKFFVEREEIGALVVPGPKEGRDRPWRTELYVQDETSFGWVWEGDLSAEKRRELYARIRRDRGHRPIWKTWAG